MESAATLCFAMAQTYCSIVLLVGALMPLRMVYQAMELLEMMHRSKYLIFDCAMMPCVAWVAVLLLKRPDFGPLGLVGSKLLAEPLCTPVLVAFGFAHLGVSYLAASDCIKYPFTHDNCLGVLYWRPARFTLRMRYPWLLVTRLLLALGIYSLLLHGQWVMLLASVCFYGAYYGHVSLWQYRPWEIYAQPLSCALLSAALMTALNVSVSCPLINIDLGSCVVVTPGGAVPLFGGLSRLRL
eukprot:TRINITY_DN108115_c0_g1_i1.p1 TRINITY_DN108115_c0_g1~~TRINITY_DN108115_c0_g1_i1.p1  ORF type:complete len:280 (+),score=32.74 TRINITY_DN108115_c0_g1_i1:122-841(+)